MPADLFVLAHGVTGTWLDEIIEIGLPLVVFIGLWIWSSRKEKARKRGERADREERAR